MKPDKIHGGQVQKLKFYVLYDVIRDSYCFFIDRRNYLLC